jgi:hypothetical protein
MRWSGVLWQIRDPANRRKNLYAALDELLEKGRTTVDCRDEQGQDNARIYPFRECE